MNVFGQRLGDENNNSVAHHAQSRWDIFLRFKVLGISITATDLRIDMLTDKALLTVTVPHRTSVELASVYDKIM